MMLINKDLKKDHGKNYEKSTDLEMDRGLTI